MYRLDDVDACPAYRVGSIVHREPGVPHVADGHETRCMVPRICVAPTIEQCFYSISQWSTQVYKEVDEFTVPPHRIFEEYYWVLEPEATARIWSADMRYVPDAYVSDEGWILEPCDFLVIGKIQMAWAAMEKGDPLEWKWIEQLGVLA